MFLIMSQGSISSFFGGAGKDVSKRKAEDKMMQKNRKENLFHNGTSTTPGKRLMKVSLHYKM